MIGLKPRRHNSDRWWRLPVRVNICPATRGKGERRCARKRQGVFANLAYSGGSLDCADRTSAALGTLALFLINPWVGHRALSINCSVSPKVEQ